MVLTFRPVLLKEQFLSLCSIEVNGVKVALQDVDRPLNFINIYDAPHALPDSEIISRLAPYGEVISHRCGRFHKPEGVLNGIRHYRVRLQQPIPSYLRFGKHLIVVKYDTQAETSRRCNGYSHYARSCRHTVCFNCDEVGHLSKDCPSRTLCAICRSPAHKAITLQHSYVSLVREVETTPIPLFFPSWPWVSTRRRQHRIRSVFSFIFSFIFYSFRVGPRGSCLGGSMAKSMLLALPKHFVAPPKIYEEFNRVSAASVSISCGTLRLQPPLLQRLA